MFSIGRTFVAGLLLAASFSVANARLPREADLTLRHDEIQNKRAPMDVKQPQVMHGFTDQRFPVTRWHNKFSPIGTRRAPITTGATRETRMIQPEVIAVNRIAHRNAPQHGRLANIRNFRHVRENEMVPSLRDAEVVQVREVSRPAFGNEERPTSMRDINRFTFQRNEYEDGPAPVRKAASGNEEEPR